MVDLLVGAPLFMDRGSDGKLREVGQVSETSTATQTQHPLALHNKSLARASSALALGATDRLTCPRPAGVGVPGPRGILLPLPPAAHGLRGVRQIRVCHGGAGRPGQGRLQRYGAAPHAQMVPSWNMRVNGAGQRSAQGSRHRSWAQRGWWPAVLPSSAPPPDSSLSPPDVAISAPYGGPQRQGLVYIHNGRPRGPDPTPSQVKAAAGWGQGSRVTALMLS